MALVVWALARGSRRPSSEPEPRSIHKPDARFSRRVHVTGTDEGWQERFLQDCESPAETAFLKAMIAGFGLHPKSGMLHGQGLSLNLQVEVARYRADFFANGWLVVEIDGAAYHSAPEALARDQERDRFMEDAGYSVVRIPAKVVFDTPRQAVAAVRSALAKGPRATPVTAVPRSKSPGEALGGVSTFITSVNAELDKALAVSDAMRTSRQTFALERIFIEAAIKRASGSVEVENTRAQSEWHRTTFDKNYKLVKEAMEKARLESGGSRGADVETTQPPIEPITPPPPHASKEVDAAVQAAHRSLMQERSEYLDGVRNRLRGDARLAEQVRKALNESSHPECWPSIL